MLGAFWRSLLHPRPAIVLFIFGGGVSGVNVKSTQNGMKHPEMAKQAKMKIRFWGMKDILGGAHGRTDRQEDRWTSQRETRKERLKRKKFSPKNKGTLVSFCQKFGHSSGDQK